MHLKQWDGRPQGQDGPGLRLALGRALEGASLTIKSELVSREGIGRWSKIEAWATIDMQKFWERSCAQELAIV